MKIKKVLVANRGEIAIRVLRACSELGIKTVAIYTYEDRYSLHRYKSDEAYQIGKDNQPLQPYLNIDAIIAIAKENDVDAIHPGYGFLSENQHFSQKCADNGLIFIGPKPNVMASLGDKIAAKKVALSCEVPIIQSNDLDLNTYETAKEEAHRIGYPLMLKAAAGGGGRGMRVIRDDEQLEKGFFEAKNEALKAFGDDTLFLEKYVENPKHIEVQIVADNYGGITHLFERDCSVQRRFQKVVEVAPAISLNEETRQKLYDYSIRICKAVNYNNVGTVEFLVEPHTNKIYFIEVNPRIQVEHTVTEMITGIDLIKTQIFIADGYPLDHEEVLLGPDHKTRANGVAIQCRITTEDPENDFKPDYGTVIAYRSAGGFGIRLDQGSVYQGAKISPFFDSLLVKVSAHAPTLRHAAMKMSRTLDEFRIRGVKQNIQFLQNIINHPQFLSSEYTVDFIKSHPELFVFQQRQDRATKMLTFLADVIVNGNPDVKNPDKSKVLRKPDFTGFNVLKPYEEGTKDILTRLGPDEFSKWLRNDPLIHYTDTTFRDGHQSLLATRMRTFDMMKVAQAFAKDHPQTFSMEVWGGATFDVCLRFLHEDPWERLASIRKAVPNILLQMLIRGSNGVGYKAYPDNLIEAFVEKSWETGVDIFRIFDSLNWMKGMDSCINFVRKRTQGLAEGSICYTGDILDPSKTKYTLEYYLNLAKQLEDAGSHILAIKDMAGLLKPYAATLLVEALRDTVKIPIHLHTHDTSSVQSATYLKAIEAGVDVVDVALGAMSGLTSQPNFNSTVEMMRFQERHREFDMASLNRHSNYWETVREYYYPFESDLKAGTAEVYRHEIPGGQYSNLRPQANALGLGDRWELIKETYGEVNQMFGDVVKVTPSSKVVGDMALYLVSNNLTTVDVLERGDQISFPESVQSFFKGELGQPVGGFPRKLQNIILKDEKPFTDKPNVHLEPVDFEKEFAEFQEKFGKNTKFTDFLSYQLYPKVYEAYHRHYEQYSDVSNIPTRLFFYGMQPGEEAIIDIAKGKSIVIKYQSLGHVNEKGFRTVFFKLNGQTRNIEVRDTSIKVERTENVKVDKANPKHIGAPLQGMLSKILVTKEQPIKKNTPLFIIEAMKMETTITASEDTQVASIHLTEGSLVNTDDLVLTLS
ncbi:pyruvate carboxylase [Pontibacter arcticus]|uniref:Pyruvate carboxylase n=1 Tax=Pontibacter arcticus TaxID=2080288 RepID=A0A364RF57_9BACT|nr:pyruvate carboxylase [Pontibacter arcticus]RAU82941.1 pyruvate carboxylase [Pontibacter arcticus]